MEISTCRICLAEICAGFRKFHEKIDSISYADMLYTLTTEIEIQNDDFLCGICATELTLSYNFLLKLKTSNHKFLEQKFQPLNEVKDPLEEDSYDENNDAVKIECIDDAFNETSIADKMNCTEAMPAEKLVSDDEDDDDKELLLNNLSDLNVSPEHLIFPKGRFKCKICDKSYFTSIGLSAHQEIHLPKMPTTKKKRLRRHQKNEVSQDLSDEAPNLLNLNDTNLSVSNDLPSTAIESNKQSQQPPTKLTKIKQTKPKKTFPCQVCGKEMISASKLRYHFKMHTGEKDFLCSMCPKAYSTIYALKHHFRTHSGYRPYECKFCGDRFYRPTTLKSHVRRHTGERPYGCEICGKRFIQHSSMTTHIKLNHMSKTIPCPHCDKKYARQTDLNTHLLSHTGDKPFSCQLCPSRFVRQANLNKHMKQQHAGNLHFDAKQNEEKVIDF